MNGTFMVNSISKNNLGKVYPFGVEVTRSPLSKHSKNSRVSPNSGLDREDDGSQVTRQSPLQHVHHH